MVSSTSTSRVPWTKSSSSPACTAYLTRCALVIVGVPSLLNSGWYQPHALMLSLGAKSDNRILLSSRRPVAKLFRRSGLSSCSKLFSAAAKTSRWNWLVRRLDTRPVLDNFPTLLFYQGAPSLRQTIARRVHPVRKDERIRKLNYNVVQSVSALSRRKRGFKSRRGRQINSLGRTHLLPV